MKTSHLDHRELPGLTEAKRIFMEARRGPATEADRPRRSRRARKQIPGQLNIFGAGNAAEEAAERRKT
jgi:hypothetical protein